MASAPLNWLLKIGGDALQTTAQTLSAAVNELKTNITNALSSINNMDDVNISTPSDGQIMIYDGTNQEWKNGAAPSTGMAVDGSNAANEVTFGGAFTVGNRATGSLVGTNSATMGSSNTASGQCAYAEGYSTVANDDYTHAEGFQTHALASTSHAEGSGTFAVGPYSHVEGYSNNSSTGATGEGAHAEGCNTTASGRFSHAEGDSTTASGADTHAEGNKTRAYGAYSHAEGYYTHASGKYSHAEGTGIVNNLDPTIYKGTSKSTAGEAGSSVGIPFMLDYPSVSLSNYDACTIVVHLGNAVAERSVNIRNGSIVAQSDYRSIVVGDETAFYKISSNRVELIRNSSATLTAYVEIKNRVPSTKSMLELEASGDGSHASGAGVHALRQYSFVHGNTSRSERKFLNTTLTEHGTHVFGFDMSGKEWMASSTIEDAVNGCEGTIVNDTTLTLDLDPQGVYLLVQTAYTISSGAIYGTALNIIAAHATGTGTPTTVQMKTSTAPTTLTMLANNRISIRNAATSRCTQFHLIRIQ